MNKVAGNTFSSSDLDSLIQISSRNLPSSVGGIVGVVVPYIFGAAGFALIIYIVFGGYQVMLSGGNPKSIDAGKSKITNAIVGFIILSASYLIVLTVAQILGLSTISGIF